MFEGLVQNTEYFICVKGETAYSVSEKSTLRVLVVLI